MKRRSFFGALFGAAAVPSTLIVTTLPSELPDQLTHGKWSLRWTGYQQAQAQDVVIGYWIAHCPTNAPDKQHAYWTSMGRNSWYYPGAMFDTSWDRAWTFLTGAASPSQLARNRQRAYDELIAWLDREG